MSGAPTASGLLGQLPDLPEPHCQRLENGALPSTSPRLWVVKGGRAWTLWA